VEAKENAKEVGAMFSLKDRARIIMGEGGGGGDTGSDAAGARQVHDLQADRTQEVSEPTAPSKTLPKAAEPNTVFDIRRAPPKTDCKG
jgi:hypothetical protein